MHLIPNLCPRYCEDIRYDYQIIFDYLNKPWAVARYKDKSIKLVGNFATPWKHFFMYTSSKSYTQRDLNYGTHP